MNLKKESVKYEFFNFLYSINHDIMINHNGIVLLFRLISCLKEFIILNTLFFNNLSLLFIR